MKSIHLRHLFALALAALSVSCVPLDPTLMDGSRPQRLHGYDYGNDPDRRYERDYDRRPDYYHDNDRLDHYDEGRRGNFGPESYRKGQELGRSDAKSGLSDNYGRHRGAYNVRYESSFAQGYREGYREGRNQAGTKWGGPREWYDSGYQLGKRDRREGKSSNWQRHRNHFDGRTDKAFAEGYEAGYRGR